MKRISLLLVFGLSLSQISLSQCIDKFGFSAGYTHSTMRWNALSGFAKPYVSGFSILSFAEKSVNQTLGIRSHLGYLSQGYGSSEAMYFSHYIYPIGNLEGFRFHQLAFDLAAKVNLSKGCLTPYLTAGIRNHYTLAFQALNPYASMEGFTRLLPSDFNRYTVSATLSIGMEICHKFYIEAEYNPALSNSIRYDAYRGRSSSFGIRAGYFLFTSKKSCAKKQGTKIITPAF